MRLIQISDLHLFADPSLRLRGIPTRETFADVLAHIDAHAGEVDQYIVTGDLTHDEQVATYQAVRSLLGDKVDRCRILPGNHDDREPMREVFPDATAGDEGPLMFAVSVGNWRWIGLDSHVPGIVPGALDSVQLDWLGTELAAHTEKPTALFMHHPPIPVGVPWMDKIGLQEPDEFCRLVETSPQVEFVASGHVHHEFNGQLGNAAVYTTPSTGVQFVPAGETPDYESAPPGYRVFDFDGDRYQTRVVRLPEVKYTPVAD